VGAHAGQLHYQPVVTRGTQSDTSPATLTARIPALLQNHTLEAAVDLELHPEHSRVMACGNPQMVEDTRQALEARGLLLSKRGQPGQVAIENSF
jgi:ferredoxin--NADP+ reductase